VRRSPADGRRPRGRQRSDDARPRGRRGDLRDRFAIGERVAASGERIRSARVELDLAHASVWRPGARGARSPTRRSRRACIAFVAPRATARDAAERPRPRSRRRRRALTAACAALDVGRATAQIDRLIGWGEGLTPAGDDFLVGLLAGLDALSSGDAERQRFRDASLRRSSRARTRRRRSPRTRFASPPPVTPSSRLDVLVAALCFAAATTTPATRRSSGCSRWARRPAPTPRAASSPH
jgi:hypothetical protein